MGDLRKSPANPIVFVSNVPFRGVRSDEIHTRIAVTFFIEAASYSTNPQRLGNVCWLSF